jgi:hypothetical protein
MRNTIDQILELKDIYEDKYIPVTESGCWLWLLGLDSAGYGKCKIHGEMFGAHRVLWMMSNGAIPDGLFVLHKCDVTCCVNPSHLYLGTHQDNIADRERRNRGSKKDGERNPSSKLKEVDIMEILDLINAGVGHKEISVVFNVTQQTIYNVAIKKTWRPYQERLPTHLPTNPDEGTATGGDATEE